MSSLVRILAVSLVIGAAVVYGPKLLGGPDCVAERATNFTDRINIVCDGVIVRQTRAVTP